MTDFIDCGNGVRLERGLRCAMRDGAELVSDHYYPAEPGPHPTLLMRQPYGRDIASTVVYAHPVWFARHGYNVVIQDVRGRGDSEGEFYPFRSERNDGADTIAWLRTRPESNGRFGMYGFSYQGVTQFLAAAEQPEGLVCIAPGMAAVDLYRGWFYHNGALRLASSMGWGLQMLKMDARRLGLREESNRLEAAWADLRSQANVLPFRDHPAIRSEALPSYVRDWFDHDRAGDYWRALDISTCLQQIQIPALHISGWYDTYLHGTIDGYVALREHAGSAFARENQYLLAGPWVHIPWGDQIGEVNFGVEALIDTDDILLRWFNHWLKDTGDFSREPRVRHFSLFENKWHAASEWPESTALTLFLHSEGRANSRKGDGTLDAIPPSSDEATDIFVYDPEVPVPSPGPGAVSGSYNQSSLEMGNNVLVYTTRALEEPIAVLGSPRVSLYCAASANSTDFTAKLVRVRTDGRADFVCIGIARSQMLFDGVYEPDRIHLWSFELEPTSCRFESGDRICLEIASSAFPLYDRNPGGDVPSARATSWDWVRSTQIVYHDAERPSALHLPLRGDTA
ncbi:CocE/NonD family hydrolase [Silvibacterium acidisoli]|uniref:CocE/NonD family hydrolase n=1 Tax=Acidobacteriaceae bacterium ZG23-2 TaxID=2883246 RepID=UPI00406C74CC